MKYSNTLLATVATALLMACSTSRPMSGASSGDHQAELAAMGVDAVLWQHTSAEAYYLYQQNYGYATAKLEARLQDIDAGEQMMDSLDRDRRPLAVVVDIDETVLDNSPYQVNAIRRGRTFDQNDWKEWTDRASAKACPGALDFLTYAASAGCEVFYITNRDIRERASTLKNLHDLGFPFADEQHLLLMEGSSDKTERRARVAASRGIL